MIVADGFDRRRVGAFAKLVLGVAHIGHGSDPAAASASRPDVVRAGPGCAHLRAGTGRHSCRRLRACAGHSCRGCRLLFCRLASVQRLVVNLVTVAHLAALVAVVAVHVLAFLLMLGAHLAALGSVTGRHVCRSGFLLRRGLAAARCALAGVAIGLAGTTRAVGLLFLGAVVGFDALRGRLFAVLGTFLLR